MGRRLCGAVEYSVADQFLYAGNCHCSNCRRMTGSAFKPFAGIERDKLSVSKGEDSQMIRRGERPRRALQGVRLAALFGRPRRWHVHVAGDASSTIRASGRQSTFVGSKVPWFTITDDLPQTKGTP